jgi:hypothetical protein
MLKYSPYCRLRLVVVRLATDIAVGLTIASLMWTAWEWQRGSNLIQALKGNTDDGIATLEAMLVIGGAVGSVIGWCHGLFIGFVDFNRRGSNSVVHGGQGISQGDKPSSLDDCSCG